jgi:hypothetical protein
MDMMDWNTEKQTLDIVKEYRKYPAHGVYQIKIIQVEQLGGMLSWS